MSSVVDVGELGGAAIVDFLNSLEEETGICMIDFIESIKQETSKSEESDVINMNENTVVDVGELGGAAIVDFLNSLEEEEEE